MTIAITSRYYGLPVYTAVDSQGKSHATVAIRPPAPPAPATATYHHVLTGVEDIEYLAWRFYASSADWWRIAEANPLLFPLDLTPGTSVNIVSPGAVGRIERTRSF